MDGTNEEQSPDTPVEVTAETVEAVAWAAAELAVKKVEARPEPEPTPDLASEREHELQQELEAANDHVGDLEKQISDEPESIDSFTCGLLDTDCVKKLVTGPDGVQRIVQIHRNL